MLMIIDDSNKDNLKILDTDDGVIEILSEEQLKQIRGNGLRFYRKPYLGKILKLYPYLVKANVLNMLENTEILKYTMDIIQFYSRNVNTFKAPSDYFSYLVNIFAKPDYFLIILNRINNEDSYLYIVSLDGIFCKHFIDVIDISLIMTTESYIRVHTRNYNYNARTTYIFDKRLNLNWERYEEG